MGTYNLKIKGLLRKPILKTEPQGSPCGKNSSSNQANPVLKDEEINYSSILQTSLVDTSCDNKEISISEKKQFEPNEIFDLDAEYFTSWPELIMEDKKEITPEKEQKETEGPKNRYTGEELMNLDTSSYIDRVEDLIPAEETSLLAAPGDSGKSLLYLQICISIVLGCKEIFSKKINAKNNSALIVATEDNEKRLSDRICKQIKKIDGDITNIKNLVIRTSGEDLIHMLETELAMKKFDLVVLDALGDILLDDTNSQTAVRKFYSDLENLIRKYKTTFLLIHHEGKSLTNSKRSRILGSVAIVDRSRSVIMLVKEKNSPIRTLTIEKSNNISEDKKGKPIRLKLDHESLTYSIAAEYVVNKEINSESSKVTDFIKAQNSELTPPYKPCKKGKPGRKLDEEKVKQAIELSEQGFTLEEIGEIVDRNKATISRWLKKKTN